MYKKKRRSFHENLQQAHNTPVTYDNSSSLRCPGIDVLEIASELLETTGADIYLSVRIGFTRQRLRLAALH